MTTLQGTLTSVSAGEVFAIGLTPEEVDYSIGPHHGRVRIERATTPAGTAWEMLLTWRNSTTTRTGRIHTRASEKLRVRALDFAANLITGGDLAAAGGWTAGTGWTIAAGVATREAGAGTPNLTIDLDEPVVPGATYRVTFDITTSAGSLTVDLGGGTASAAVDDAEATVSVDLVAGSSNDTLRFIAGATYAGTIDNVVVTPVITFSLSDIDESLTVVRDAEGNVLMDRRQDTHYFPRNLSVAGDVTVAGSVISEAVGINGFDRKLGGRISQVVAASAALTASSTETVFSNGSVSIPANTLRAGDIIKVRFQGICTAANGSDTLQVKLYVNGLSGTALITIPATDATANDIFTGEYEILIRTIGESGTMVGVGTFKSIPAAEGTMTIKDDILASTAIDTTAPITIDVAGKFSSTNAGNSCRLDFLRVEIV